MRRAVGALLVLGDATLTRILAGLGLAQQDWSAETDLRTLKSQFGLERLRSQSPVMAHKELVLAVTADNLIRAVMALAARAAGLSPRQISYTGTQGLVRAFGPLLAATADAAERARRTAHLLRRIAQRKLPQRAARPAPPRAACGRPKSYPTPQSLQRKAEREAAAAM